MRVRNIGFASFGEQVARTDAFVIAVYARVSTASMCFGGRRSKRGSHCNSVGVFARVSAKAVKEEVGGESGGWDVFKPANRLYEKAIMAYSRWFEMRVSDMSFSCARFDEGKGRDNGDVSAGCEWEGPPPYNFAREV